MSISAQLRDCMVFKGTIVANGTVDIDVPVTTNWAMRLKAVVGADFMLTGSMGDAGSATAECIIKNNSGTTSFCDVAFTPTGIINPDQSTTVGYGDARPQASDPNLSNMGGGTFFKAEWSTGGPATTNARLTVTNGSNVNTIDYVAWIDWWAWTGL